MLEAAGVHGSFGDVIFQRAQIWGIGGDSKAGGYGGHEKPAEISAAFPQGDSALRGEDEKGKIVRMNHDGGDNAITDGNFFCPRA